MNPIKNFSEPYAFSFKDFMAILTTIPFLAMVVVKNFWGIGDYEAITFLKTGFEIVLGGYFIHETARMGVRYYSNKNKVDGESEREVDYNKRI